MHSKATSITVGWGQPIQIVVAANSTVIVVAVVVVLTLTRDINPWPKIQPVITGQPPKA